MRVRAGVRMRSRVRVRGEDEGESEVEGKDEDQGQGHHSRRATEFVRADKKSRLCCHRGMG